MRYLFPCSLIALVICASAGRDARAGRPEPRLCGRVSLSVHDIHRRAGDPLQQAARELARRLLRLDSAVEHGAIFYRGANGSIRTGTIAAGDESAVQLNVDVRPGEAIVGALHTHARYPYYRGDPLHLSRDDVEVGAMLLALPQTDRKLRLYIVDVRRAMLAEYASTGHCTKQ